MDSGNCIDLKLQEWFQGSPNSQYNMRVFGLAEYTLPYHTETGILVNSLHLDLLMLGNIEAQKMFQWVQGLLSLTH